MNAIQSALEKMGSNFFVAAFIPSLAFISISVIAFEPILPDAILLRLGGTNIFENSDSLFSNSAILILVLSVVLAFTLTSLSTFVYKLFEGYVGLNRFGLFIKGEKARARKLNKQTDFARREINQLNQLLKNAPILKNSPYSYKIEQRITELKIEVDNLRSQYDYGFPPGEQYLLPTRFGNLLRSAEAYSRTRYNLDAVPMWPRMASVIPPSYASKIEDSSNQCSFLLNCALLCIVFGVSCMLASLYQWLLSILLSLNNLNPLYFISIDAPDYIYHQRVWIYLVVGVIGMVVARFFYLASLYNVNRYGLMIRSAFDLFRFDLLKQLHFQLPDNLRNEKDLWSRICEFINSGVSIDILDTFGYKHPK